MINIKMVFYVLHTILLSINASEVEDFDVACQIFTEAKNTGFIMKTV